MEVVFKKDKRFKYICANCGKQFNWDENSCRYGKYEYKSVEEKHNIERVFCSTDCYNKYCEINTIKI